MTQIIPDIINIVIEAILPSSACSSPAWPFRG